MGSLRFGIFDTLDKSGAPISRQYAERLELVEAAEAAGFYCYHLAEHHGTPLCLAPSPSVFLATVAERTGRIRLGPLCYLLPMYEPLRLIEEICMLDQLSEGRLELGISRGVSPYELAFFGVAAEDSRAIFDEVLEVILAGLTSPSLDHEGERYRYSGVPMEMTTVQRPYPPLWYPTSELASIERVARNGLNFVGLGPASRVRVQVDEYWRVWEEHRDDPGRLNAHVSEPAVGINRHVFVADSDDEALTIARQAHTVWNASILKLWHDHGDDRDDAKFSWEAATQSETFLFGTPDTVGEQMSRLLDESGCNYLNLSFAWGSLTHERVMRSLALFAEEVMPRFAADAALAAQRPDS